MLWYEHFRNCPHPLLGINEFRRQPAIYIQPVFPHFHIVSGKKLNTSIVSLSKMAKSIKKKIFFRAARTFQGTFSFSRLPNQILLLLLRLFLTPKADSIKSPPPPCSFVTNFVIKESGTTHGPFYLFNYRLQNSGNVARCIETK